MNRVQRRDYREALVGTLLNLPRPLFHVTAMLPPGSARRPLEQCLRAWAARVDRLYLGRNWLRRATSRMDGVCFFETFPGPHAHLIVTPPVGAPCLHFEMHAGSLFARDVEASLLLPNPVTRRGRMLVQRIGDGDGDLARTLRYASKETDWRPDAAAEWCFLSGLSDRPVA